MTNAETVDIDENYAKTALSLVRKVLQGNGVRPADVNIKAIDGKTLEFKAATHIVPHNKLTQKTVSGKAGGGGQVFQDAQAARQAADGYVSKAIRDAGVVDQIKTMMGQKPHQGFGLQDKAMKLSFLDRDFVSQQTCKPCQGRGRTRCPQCDGKGYEPCRKCEAEGFEECRECNGSRQVPGPQGQMQTCPVCQGLGKTSCSFCRESRQVQCRVCQTKGEIQCKSCSGHGAQSEILHAEVTAECIYDFDADVLPDKAVAAVKVLGAALADRADVSPSEDGVQGDKEKDALHFIYDVRVPQGDLTLTVKDKEVQAYLLGTKGAIQDIPDFLDEVIAPGLQSLSQAARGEGNIDQHIQAAVKYKTVRQAMVLTARYNAKKAVKALLHYTPFGLSPQAAQRLVKDAGTALKNATKKQRMLAKLSGGGAVAALAALYFFSPLRDVLLGQVANASLHIVMDCMVLGICGAAGYGIWRTISTRAREHALKSFVPSK